MHVPQQTTWSSPTIHFCGQIQRFIRNFWGTNNGTSVNNEAACYELNNLSILQVWQVSLDYGCLICIFTVISRQALGSIWPPTMYVKEDPSAYVKCVEADKSSTKKQNMGAINPCSLCTLMVQSLGTQVMHRQLWENLCNVFHLYGLLTHLS